MSSLRRKRRSPEQIIAQLREADGMLSAGQTIGQVCQKLGICTLRGKDVVRILESEFRVGYTLNGAYDLLHRLGYSCLTPRPVHEKNDPVAIQHFKESAPFL